MEISPDEEDPAFAGGAARRQLDTRVEHDAVGGGDWLREGRMRRGRQTGRFECDGDEGEIMTRARRSARGDRARLLEPAAIEIPLPLRDEAAEYRVVRDGQLLRAYDLAQERTDSAEVPPLDGAERRGGEEVKHRHRVPRQLRRHDEDRYHTRQQPHDAAEQRIEHIWCATSPRARGKK